MKVLSAQFTTGLCFRGNNNQPKQTPQRLIDTVPSEIQAEARKIVAEDGPASGNAYLKGYLAQVKKAAKVVK